MIWKYDFLPIFKNSKKIIKNIKFGLQVFKWKSCWTVQIDCYDFENENINPYYGPNRAMHSTIYSLFFINCSSECPIIWRDRGTASLSYNLVIIILIKWTIRRKKKFSLNNREISSPAVTTFFNWLHIICLPGLAQSLSHEFSVILNDILEGDLTLSFIWTHRYRFTCYSNSNVFSASGNIILRYLL